MWVNKVLFQQLLDDNRTQQKEVLFERTGASRMSATVQQLHIQKAKDDLSLDWMRHRVNALEKQNAVLMMKATGMAMPIPEIVPTRPGTITMIGEGVDGPNFDMMPSFEDSGDAEAERLGITHTADGAVVYSR